jgi:DNA polymerase V
LPGRVVIAVINGEHTVKRLHREGDRLLLLAENADYAPIEVSELEELHIWGVITCVLHAHPLAMQIALVDCNNFYASCEAEFQPKLSGLALVVLSNNDGCVVARSPQAKAAGIRMGEPVFKIQHLIAQQNVQVFSSNYALYGDMSQRVMITLAQFTPEIEIYSIDEAFLDLSGFEHRDLAQYGQEIRDRIKQWTGISVSVGIAPTKTLAKVANRIAKKSGSGVCHLAQLNANEVLSAFDIEDVWGIDRRYAKSLRSHGITIALQLRDTDLAWAKQPYSVVMQ